MIYKNSLFFYIACLALASCRSSLDYPSETLNPLHMETLKSAPARSQPPPKALYVKENIPAVPPAMKKRISITVTEAVPLKNIFIELARQAKVNLQLDPQIKGQIIFSTTDQPFIEVIKEICGMARLRSKIHGQALRIERDTPYSATYTLPFLNLTRTAENRISIATDVFSAVKNDKSSTDNGSHSSILGKGNTDFWTEIDSNLKTILASQPFTQAEEGKQGAYSLHRQGGIITVYGTTRQHNLVEEYLHRLRQAVSTQVLIEAKVIEVNLKDEYKGGINWQKLAGGGFHADIALGDFAQRGRFGDPASSQANLFSMGLAGKTFSSLLKAIEEFGASRTLSSPRLTVMNNQTAILKVAQNQVYFRLNYDKQLNLSVERESINVSSDIQTVPIGLVMSVHPSVDPNTGAIILSLRPTISRLAHSVSDPAVDIAFANVRSTASTWARPSLVPVVEVREIESVLRLQSGEVAVLGGLMEVRSTNQTAKVPLVGELPGIGQLFRASADGNDVVELVILLRATIVEEGPPPDLADQRLYQSYVGDPRPIDFPPHPLGA